MVLFYRYSKRTLALLAVILVVEYAIVHRISLDALTRSEAGLSQWRQLATDCNCTDCEVRHLTLIHDGLYQRAYSVHLLHRVLTISSEDGDPYDAFDEADDDVTDEDSLDGFRHGDDPAATGLVPSGDGAPKVPYAYAPGDMLSTPVSVPATLQAVGQAPTSPAASAPNTVPALPASSPPAEPQHQQHQQQQRLTSPHAGGGAASAFAAAEGAAAPESPRLLQALVWQPGKVLSVFPWQLRAHFFLSLASTRMYLLMGLWPRAAAVAAAAPRRLRQPPPQPPPHGHGQPTGAAGAGTSGSSVPYQSYQHQGHGHDVPPPYGYAGGGGTASGGGGGGYPPAHPHAQAQATAHAYAQYAHGYDGTGGLYGISRTVTDESQSLAAALSALGRGVPVFVPPEMLVQHGVQEDLMASCVFKPAVRHAPGASAAAGGGGDGGIGGAGEGGGPLPRWRVWPSLLSRWVAHIAGRIAHHGGRAAAKLRQAGAGAGGQGPDGADPGDGRRGVPAGAASPQPQHAYVECRLYRTDRARNVSHTCPAVLTVLPSPPRGARLAHPHHPHQQQQHQQQQQQQQQQQPPTTQGAAAATAAAAAAAPAAASSCPAGGGACPAGAPSPSPPPPPHLHHQQLPTPPLGRPPRSRLLRRLWLDLRYMLYGVAMPYKWAPILAGLLSPHMFLLACLPAVRSLGLMGPFTVRICAYHAVCLVLTGADHLLLLRLASELWLRVRRGRGPGGRGWRRWLVWGRWLLVDGFLASGWGFRVVVIGILTVKQVELWNHLYGTSFQPHPLLSCCLVLPASWLTTCAACSAMWRLSSGHQPTSAPLLLFQEGFLSGLSSPLYSLVYITFAVLGLGGGGVGGGAGGVVGLAVAGSRLPLWLLDAVAVSPLLAVVALDVLWNMDAAARATPLLLVIVNALRVNSGPADGAAAFGRRRARGRGLLGAGPGEGGGGGGMDLDGRLFARDGGALKHTSLWMLLEAARWWAQQVRDAAEEQRRQEGPEAAQLAGGEAAAGGGAEGPQQPELGRGGGGDQPDGAWAARMGAAGAVARMALAARHAGMVELPPRAIAGMMAALLLPLPEARWPPRQLEHHARALDLLLEAAAAGPGLRRGRRRGPGPRGGGRGGVHDDDDDDADGGAFGGGGFGAGGGHGFGEGDDDFDADGVDEVLAGGGGGGAGAEDGGGEGGGGGERMVRTADGSVRPLSALEAELRTGLAQVAALRSQLAAVGRGVADLLLLGRWPPPLQLPAEALCWCEQVPHGFLCPITHSLMTQPALLVSPQLSEASPTYEMSAIRQWLRSNRTDPTTGRYLHTYHFIHNDNLRKAIEDWVLDRLEREQQQQQQQKQQQPQQQRLSPGRRPQRGTPVAALVGGGGATTPGGRAAAPLPPAAADPGSPLRSPPRGRLLLPGASASAAGHEAAAAVPYQGRYQPVAGPGPGQRSVCIGTSEAGLRLQSPERLRPGERGLGAGTGRSRSRARSLSRGGPLRGVNGGGGGGGAQGGPAAGSGGGGGQGVAALLARQAVQRATSRQRGLQRGAQPQ